MTTDRDFNGIAMAWLADGPEELSDRVIDAAVDEIHQTRQRRAARLPWRLPTMTALTRVAALVAVGALILAGIAVVGSGGRNGPSLTQSFAPSAAAVAPSLSTTGLPVLDTQFMSPRNGYSVKYPAGWTISPATQSWQRGKEIRWGDPTLDAIQTGDARFVAAGQTLAPGQTAAQWMKVYCLGARKDTGQCNTVPASWKPIKIAGSDAYIDLDGVAADPGTIAPGGRIFDAVVINANTAWAFTLDGYVDRAMFDAFLATVSLRPASLVSVPALTATFTSPLFGFSMKILPEWKATASTQRWTGIVNDENADGVTFTGTDSGISGRSQPLGNKTFDDFVAEFHADQKAHVPTGCDGGSPSTWPEVAIGDKIGHLEMLCNAAEALVEDGGRVYLFEWGNDTFDTTQHFPIQDWEQVLKSVTLTPDTAQ